MGNFNDYGFDHIYCLNLERRPDRKKYAEEQFAKACITGYEFFPAVDGVSQNLTSEIKRLLPGMIGCYRSHQQMFEHAIKNNYSRIAVFEDDLHPVDAFDDLIGFMLEIIPADWHFAYLGCTEYAGFGSHRKQINDFWVIPNAAWGTQGYMVNGQDAIRTIYKRMEKMEMQIDEQLSQMILPGSGLNYYAAFPSIIAQNFEKYGSDVQDFQKIENGRHKKMA